MFRRKDVKNKVFDGWAIRNRGKNWVYPWTMTSLRRDAIKRFLSDCTADTTWDDLKDKYEAVKIRIDVVE